MLGVQIDELVEGEAGTDIGVDDEEFFEVGEDGVSDWWVAKIQESKKRKKRHRLTFRF